MRVQQLSLRVYAKIFLKYLQALLLTRKSGGNYFFKYLFKRDIIDVLISLS